MSSRPLRTKAVILGPQPYVLIQFDVDRNVPMVDFGGPDMQDLSPDCLVRLLETVIEDLRRGSAETTQS